MGRLKNELGNKYGKLTVVERVANKRGRPCWRVLCECGNYAEVPAKDLRSGNTRSCGCFNIGNFKHGKRKTPEYNTWNNMKRRCLDVSNQDYHNYGGRGIKVCDRWLNSFENFLEDMGEKPSNSHSLDRKDTNRDYEPDNCRWATTSQQARNRRNNRNITWKGETLCLIAWSEKLNISYSTLKYRLRKGWSLERAFTKPIRGRK